MKLTVLLVAYNQLEHLRRLLEQLRKQTLEAGRFDIIIVDDASTDGTPEYLRAFSDPRIETIICERNVGRSAARNRGLSKATGDIVVMIDSDHSIQPDFLDLHAAAHEQQQCAVVGKSLYEHHPDYVALHTYLDGTGSSKHPGGARLPGRYFASANCSIHRTILADVGHYDESLKHWGGEDLDLGVRIAKAGFPILNEPRAVAIHHHLRPIDARLQNIESFGLHGIPLLLKKHPELFSELNLDQTIVNPYRKSRYGSLHRAVVRLLMSPPGYSIIKSFVNLFKRFKLPRILLDYLHLRQYTRGYSQYLKQLSSHR